MHIGCSKYKQIVDTCNFKSSELINYFNHQIKKIANKCKNRNLEAACELLMELDSEIFNHISLIYLFKETEFNRFSVDKCEDNDEDLLNRKPKNKKEEQLNDKQLERIVNELSKNKCFKIEKDDLGLIVFKGLNRMFDLENLKQLKQLQLDKMKVNLRSTNLRRCVDKEFTFVADCSRPASYSRKLPQKLNFIVQSNDDSRKLKVLMNGQFSEDIVYF